MAYMIGIFAGLGPAKIEVHNYSIVINLTHVVVVAGLGKPPYEPPAYLKSIEVLRCLHPYFIVL
jgi:hypothetical protein